MPPNAIVLTFLDIFFAGAEVSHDEQLAMLAEAARCQSPSI
jgi:hypothetical protein